MKKFFVIGLFGLVMSFFVGTAVVQAQEATSTPTPSPTEAPTATPTPTGSSVPSGAPQTGFGR